MNNYQQHKNKDFSLISNVNSQYSCLELCQDAGTSTSVDVGHYLKEFAGISYLTQEFGDREEDGSSLYLKNITNITQEMQIEILKRDKLNYVFQSLKIGRAHV